MYLYREVEPYPSTCRKLKTLARLGFIEPVDEVIHNLSLYYNVNEDIVSKYRLVESDRDILQWMIDIGRGIIVTKPTVQFSKHSIDSKSDKRIIQAYIEHMKDDFPLLVITSKKDQPLWYKSLARMFPEYNICVLNSKAKSDSKYESKYLQEGCQIYISSQHDVMESSLVKYVNVGVAILDEIPSLTNSNRYQYLLEIPKVFMELDYDHIVSLNPEAYAYANKITCSLCMQMIEFLDIINSRSNFFTWLNTNGATFFQNQNKKELLELCGINTSLVREVNGVIPCGIKMTAHSLRMHLEHEQKHLWKEDDVKLVDSFSFELLTAKVDFVKRMAKEFNNKTMIVASKRVSNSLRMHLRLLKQSVDEYINDEERLIIVLDSEITDTLLSKSNNVIVTDIVSRYSIENLVNKTRQYTYNLYIPYANATYEETFLKKINIISS